VALTPKLVTSVAARAGEGSSQAIKIAMPKKEIQVAGATTTRAIAAALNARAIRTARGGERHATTVRNLLGRGDA
jgi:hypothetical protein